MTLMTYEGLVPILPLVPQFCVTLWALLAPHLVLCVLLGFVFPSLFFYTIPLAGFAVLWRLYDPIGRQIWPALGKHPSLCGIYGGSEEIIGNRKRAVMKVDATYNPTPWLWGGDQRTIATAPERNCAEKLSEVCTKGIRGDLLLQLSPLAMKGESPIVFTLGGIAGDPQSPFMQDMQQACLDRGWGFAVWVTRPDLLPGKLANIPDVWTDATDIHKCLEFLRASCPRAPLHLIGYSAGASMALMYCARYGDDALCDAAVAISGSFTPVPLYCPHYRRYWQPWLTAHLKLMFYKRYADELPPREAVAGASNYVQLLDSMPHIGPASRLVEKGLRPDERHNIRRPLLFFASADDPFHPIDKVGIDPTLPSVLYYVTDCGGHVAWPEGLSADCGKFHPRVILAFLGASD